MRRTGRKHGWRAGPPAVEPLESRQLLSGGGAGMRRPGPPTLPLPGRAIAALSSSGDASTPPDRVRQNFFAAFTGSYAVGAGRIEGQALQTYLNVAGTSNTFLHGQAQVAVAIPTDPSGGLAGSASLYDKNYGQTGNFLMLDLEGDPQPQPNGRPTRLTWTIADGSSGTFDGAEGQGTVVITYHPGAGGRRPAHALDWGRVGIQFRGQISVKGTTNSLRLK